jgi:glycosyltransferase involved in cell wall biosynthesis
MRTFSVFALPSLAEGMPVTLLEAMACGLPVVAAASTGSTSLVDNGISGRLVPPGGTRQFAEALRRYIAEPALRRRHGAAGELRSRDFGWDRINDAVVQTYLRLLRHAQRPAV